MVGVIDGFRWALGSDVPFNAAGLCASISVSALLLFSGVKYFRAMEINPCLLMP
jgi:hypothetical protein